MVGYGDLQAVVVLEERQLRVLSTNPQAAGREKLDLEWVFEPSKPTHSETLHPIRPHPHSFHLVPLPVSLWGHFHSNHPP